MIFPFKWVFTGSSSQHRKKGLVESFNKSIRLWIIGSGMGFGNSKKLTHISHNFRLGLLALIRVQLLWRGEPIKYFSSKDTGNSGCFLIGNGKYLHLTGEVVTNYQDV